MPEQDKRHISGQLVLPASTYNDLVSIQERLRDEGVSYELIETVPKFILDSFESCLKQLRERGFEGYNENRDLLIEATKKFFPAIEIKPGQSTFKGRMAQEMKRDFGAELLISPISQGLAGFQGDLNLFVFSPKSINSMSDIELKYTLLHERCHATKWQKLANGEYWQWGGEFSAENASRPLPVSRNLPQGYSKIFTVDEQCAYSSSGMWAHKNLTIDKTYLQDVFRGWCVAVSVANCFIKLYSGDQSKILLAAEPGFTRVGGLYPKVSVSNGDICFSSPLFLSKEDQLDCVKPGGEPELKELYKKLLPQIKDTFSATLNLARSTGAFLRDHLDENLQQQFSAVIGGIKSSEFVNNVRERLKEWEIYLEPEIERWLYCCKT